MTFCVKWYECSWWCEESFPDREAAQEFAVAKSWQKRCEARLYVRGRWVATWKMGDPVETPP